jgi:N-acetylmuramic acid 6-phosphate etherase
MKAGAATKMALSLLSTAAMLRLGKLPGGRMIDLAPTSAKLRRRAVRIVVELGGVGARRAERALAASGWRVRSALEALDRAAPPPRGDKGTR